MLKFCKTHEWVPLCIACQNGKLRCGYSPDLLAILQGNLGRTTPVFASVATLAVLAIPLRIALTRTFVLVIIRLRD